MKAYLCSTNNGNSGGTVNGHQGRWQSTKPASGKIVNCSYYYSFICLFIIFIIIILRLRKGAWKDAGVDAGKDYDKVQDKTNLAKILLLLL